MSRWRGSLRSRIHILGKVYGVNPLQGGSLIHDRPTARLDYKEIK